jgi:flavin reductase (DIM6/NTAB) family NADH-FMN oxidoreductase RutF
MPIAPSEFRQVCGKFATGITVLTARDAAGTPHGMTANAFTSVSLEPPLVLVCVDLRAHILRHLRVGGAFAVNVLREHQVSLSVRFAQSVEDRFETVEWKPGERTGAPILAAALASIECVGVRLVEAGDHSIVIGEVLSGWCEEGKPLVYFSSRYRRLGEGVLDGAE